MSYPCVICDKVFPDKQQLQDHFRKHATHPNRIPSIKHLKSKTAPSVECDVCNAKFPTVSHAISHKFKLHGSNCIKYYCPWCGKQFTLKQLLKLHLDSDHRDKEKKLKQSAKKYSCKNCNAYFYEESMLNKHDAQFHYINMEPLSVFPPSKKIVINSVGDVQSAFYCQYCGQQYVLKYNLQNHLKRQHSDMKNNEISNELIKCSTCDAYFCNEKAFKVHNLFHKPDDLYVTSEEIRQSVVTRIDQDFDLRRVRVNKLFKLPPAKRRKAFTNDDKKDEFSLNEKDSCSFSPPPSDSSEDEEINEDLYKNEISTSLEAATLTTNHLNPHVAINNNSDNNSNTHSSDDNENSQRNYDKESKTVLNKCTTADNNLSNIPNVKVISKEELQKLKSKGLVKLISKDKVNNLKKISIVSKSNLDETSNSSSLTLENNSSTSCKLIEEAKPQLKTYSKPRSKLNNTNISVDSDKNSSNTIKNPRVLLKRLDENELNRHLNKHLTSNLPI